MKKAILSSVFLPVFSAVCAESETLARAWPHRPISVGDSNALPSTAAAEGLLPAGREYYRFNGSLTTTPCSEGVIWLVMKEPVSASKEQLEAFAELMRYPNNRPVQPTNAPWPFRVREVGPS